MARGKKGVTYKKNKCSLVQGQGHVQGAVNPKIDISLIEARCHAVSHTAVRGASSFSLLCGFMIQDDDDDILSASEDLDSLDLLTAEWCRPNDQTLFCQVCQIPQTQFGPGIV